LDAQAKPQIAACWHLEAHCIAIGAFLMDF
jgi:hypothetical protein